MAKLNQILAVEKGVKARSYATVTELDKHIQKEALHTGISRTYRKKDDDGEDLPAERSLVQISAAEVLDEVRRAYTDAWNVTATKEWANQTAVADLVIDGVLVLTGVPVTYLLFLEKQLVDLRTLVGRLPILDPAEKWSWDANSGAYVAEMHETHRTKKVPKVLVKYPATPEHPAQVETYAEDVIVGFWETIKFSGAMPAARKTTLLERLDSALQAVKTARESANDVIVTNQTVAGDLLDHLFAA